jgi:hypothetical protein
MFKPHEFNNEYIKLFDDMRRSNIIETPKNTLIQRQKELQNNNGHLGIKEKEELNKVNQIIKLLDNTNINNTKSRKIFFDEREFNND